MVSGSSKWCDGGETWRLKQSPQPRGRDSTRSPFRAPSVQDCRCRLAAVSDKLMQGGAEIRDTPCALSVQESLLYR